MTLATLIILWLIIGLAVAIAFGVAAGRMRRDRAHALPRPDAVLPYRPRAHGPTRC